MDINTVINTQPAAVEEKPSKRKYVEVTEDSESESDELLVSHPGPKVGTLPRHQ